MSRGPRGPRKRTRPAKPQRPAHLAPSFEDDDEGDLRDSPEYKKRQAIIRVGTGILLFAFLSTSGITCIASNMSSDTDRQQQEQTQQAEQNPGQSPLSAEIARYQSELKNKPGDTELQRLLGVCLVERAKTENPAEAQKDLAEARTQFEGVLKNDPDNMQVWVGLGHVNLLQKDAAKALESYGKAMELAKRPIKADARDKDSLTAENEQVQVDTHLGQAKVHLELDKKYEEALADLDAALKLNPGVADGYLLRGRVQMARKQPEAARRDFTLAKEIAETLPPGSQEQMNIYSQYVAAMKILDPKALEAPPMPAPSAIPSTSSNTSAPGNVTVNTTVTNDTVVRTTTPVNGTAPVNATTPANGTNP